MTPLAKDNEIKISQMELLENILNARKWSERATCLKKKVGAVLYNLDVQAIVGVGWSGAKIDCKECVRNDLLWTHDSCWSIHAEMRAIVNVDPSINLGRSIMFSTHGPCDQCIKLLSYKGVRAVIYEKPYRTDYSKWNGRILILNLQEVSKCSLIEITEKTN